MFRIEHDFETGEVTQIELTEKEIAELQERSKKDLLRSEAALKLTQEKATEKAALLAQLGITEDQAKLLLS
jgi:hypothetical protein